MFFRSDLTILTTFVTYQGHVSNKWEHVCLAKTRMQYAFARGISVSNNQKHTCETTGFYNHHTV